VPPTLPDRVFLTRHAETAAPAVFHGAESDIGLSDLGRRQAAAAAGWFAGRGLTAAVSSAMTRARDTAAPIAAACGVPHVVVPELHERRVGALGGTAFDHLTGPWADTIARWVAGDTAYTTPGAESFADLQARLLPAWRAVVEAHPGGRPLVVAHGVVCKVLLLSLLPGWGASGWTRIGRVSNLSVSELVPHGDGWSAAQLLIVPPPVAALTAGVPTGVGKLGVRSEA
jgi:2,3-bisphosphoglycerate-dependent phosphoglycerate mutase